MNQVRSILEDVYQLSESSGSTYSALSENQENWVNAIIEKAESFRGVLTVPDYIARQKDSDPHPRCPLSSRQSSKWLFRQRLRHRSYNPLHEREI